VPATTGEAAIEAVSAALCGTPEVWRQWSDPPGQSRFLATAVAHRVRPLLGWRLRQSGELASWPVALRQALAGAERAEAALEIVRRNDLCRLLQAFASADVAVVLLKGAALAYSIYPEPWLRPREDTDVLVRTTDVDRAVDVLASAGFGSPPRQRGRFVTHQRLFVRSDASGRRDAYDLHWKIANPAPFADLLSPDDLLHDAATVALTDPQTARVPSRSHALLIACWHRVSHHHDSDDLLWLYDLHLLLDRATDADLEHVLEVARRTRTGAICARGLRLASQRFASRLPPSLLADLERSDGAASSVTAAYLRPDARQVDLLAADLKSLDWPSRVRLLREHLFPPAAYMSETYGRSSRMLLPAFYLWRIASGARQWFRRP
jgi:hypothetical protein